MRASWPKSARTLGQTDLSLSLLLVALACQNLPAFGISQTSHKLTAFPKATQRALEEHGPASPRENTTSDDAEEGCLRHPSPRLEGAQGQWNLAYSAADAAGRWTSRRALQATLSDANDGPPSLVHGRSKSQLGSTLAFAGQMPRNHHVPRTGWLLGYEGGHEAIQPKASSPLHTAYLVDGLLLLDYPALREAERRGITFLRPGPYILWAWGRGPELRVSIGEQTFQAKASQLGWHHLGTVSPPVGRVLAVRTKSVPETGDVTNCVGYLVLSRDPAFEPQRAAIPCWRSLDDGGRFFVPPACLEEWLPRQAELRRRIGVCAGLWPELPRWPLRHWIFGKQLRDGYQIERVVLESLPGFYLTGTLYRPAPWVPRQEEPMGLRKQKEAWEAVRSSPKKPGILCPHGHWRYGRFEPEVQKRCKQLARMGAVVFSYDMVGRGDLEPFGHSFQDEELRLTGFSLFGLQTWNSLRAMEFLLSLPDVDPERVACTGASGGGTQTFFLSAIEERVRVAAPVVMVSQDMQGGCSCENADGLRIGTDNAEIAALTAPRPQIFICARDWTWEFPTKGFPQVRQVYALYGKQHDVEVDRFDYPHNYNQVSRERVYRFFAKHLFQIDPSLTAEWPAEAEPQENLSAASEQAPVQAPGRSPASLKSFLVALAVAQASELCPARSSDWPSQEQELREAFRIRLGLEPVWQKELLPWVLREGSITGGRWRLLRLGKGWTPRAVALELLPEKSPPQESLLIAVAEPVSNLLERNWGAWQRAQRLVQSGRRVLWINPFGLGDAQDPFRLLAERELAHFGSYNRPLLGEQVQDLVTAVSYLAQQGASVHVLGDAETGVAVLLAVGQGPPVQTAVVDLGGFEYVPGANVPPQRILPGALRLGGLRTAAACVQAERLVIFGANRSFDAHCVRKRAELVGSPRVIHVEAASASPATLLDALNW
jgi:dienelactone hydrolase